MKLYKKNFDFKYVSFEANSFRDSISIKKYEFRSGPIADVKFVTGRNMLIY